MFDKHKCLANIRQLLQSSDVKIGQIEKAAKCQPGYLSRIEKPTNTAEPSITFVSTAAEMLNTSIDTLVYASIAQLSPSEQYILNFLNRLRQKTTKGYIEWASEKASILNGDETDDRGECDHPLFTYRVRDTYDSTIIRQPNRYGFNSSTFGSNTLISDDCYHYSMEPGVTLFLMNVAEQCPSNLIEEHTAKEIWMYIDQTAPRLVATNHGIPSIANAVNLLFKEVAAFVHYPCLGQVHKDIIDRFMSDDVRG